MSATKLWDPYADFQKSVLPNGLSVHHNFLDRPFLKVGFVIHSGSFADPIGREGLAHFVEHMLSKNIKDVSCDDAEFFFEKLGGDCMLGETSELSTRYWFNIPADPEVLKKSLDIFGDMILGGSFEEYLERERGVVLCEFREYFPISMMYDLCQIHKQQMLYAGMDISHHKGTLGNEQSINSITKDDLEQFHAVNYVPANISVVVVGGMQSEEFLEVLSGSMFSAKLSGERRSLPQICLNIIKPVESISNLRISDIIKDTAINMAFYSSFFASSGDANMNMLRIFRRMLQHILDAEVRQKFGSTYSVKVEIKDYVQVREFYIGSKVNPNLIENMPEIVEQGLMKFKKEVDLFDTIKEINRCQYTLLDISGRSLLQNAIDDLGTYHRIISVREEIDLTEKVEFGEVCALADYVVDASNRWTFINRP